MSTQSKTDRKYAAQDLLLAWMAEAIERKHEDGDFEMENEMRRQAQRVMRLFGVVDFNGL
jgi:hypothetical protein